MKKNIGYLFQSKAERFVRKTASKVSGYVKGLPESKLGHYTEQFITKGARVTSPIRTSLYRRR